MSARDGRANLQAVVRSAPNGVEVDGSEETANFLATLNVVRGDPPEPLSIADGDDWIQALPWSLTGTYSWAEFISHGQRGEPLAAGDLPHRLDLFESDLKRHDLAPTTVSTYISHAKRMVRWTAQSPGRMSGGLQALLEEYEADVRGRDLAPLTVQTYLYGPAVFIRWLLGTYVPGQPTPAGDDVDEDDSWMSEQETQARLVRWLETNGWHDIEQSVGHQHGVDVTATRDGLELAVEVKGHPQSRLVAGENKGAKRTFHPAAQARTYFANALHAVMTTIQRRPDALHAIALPLVPRYRAMVAATEAPLRQLGVGVYLVPREGDVETVVEPIRRQSEGSS
ncbi:MAG TPA: hypothetical protein VHR55_03290 [Candidatus Limnocylindria bacterium]|nr:hypothetical protein [Candidatus Limnocylindria bacterium]